MAEVKLNRYSNAPVRNRRVGILMTPDEFKTLDEAAKMARLSKSEYIIQAIVLMAKKQVANNN